MYYYGHPPPYHHGRTGSLGYPVQAARPLPPHLEETDAQLSQHQRQPSEGARPIHQGSQTFVTAIAVGQGNKTMHPSGSKRSKAEEQASAMAVSSLPSHVGHHRKMSSFSSIGTLLGSGLFSPGDDKAGGHHRHTSSTVSFLAGLEMGLEGNDDAFLRNLQASNNAATGGFSAPSPTQSGSQQPSSAKAASSSAGKTGGTKLAAGGTSKRVRRKCTVEGCGNRVVQGGLCISHGAKRKTCKHPGCNKNVKKAGLCSTHGPARKRCEYQSCGKVAVQGGRCIAHGAKKKLCLVEGCAKQAILAGMCKKHHDQNSAKAGRGPGTGAAPGHGGTAAAPTSAPRGGVLPVSHKPTHTRGLSIFQDLSADAVSSLLNNESGASSAAPSNSSSGGGGSDGGNW